MSIDDFARYSKVLYRLTADFVRAVPDDKWDFTPDPPGRSGRVRASHRLGDGVAPFCKQVRHVVCVRGVYNAALATKRVDWIRKHEHYVGPLTREALLAALDDKQRQLLATLETVDVDALIDWDGTSFNLAMFTWEFDNTRRSITASGASMRRSPGSTRRPPGASRGACEDPHSDIARLLAQHNLAFPKCAARVRMLHLPTPNRRTELMIIYGEAVRDDSPIPIRSEGLPFRQRFSPTGQNLLDHARTGLTIRKH